jgi:hypothetical protein
MCATTFVLFASITWVAYRRHIKPFREGRLERVPKMLDRESGAIVDIPVQYQPRIPLIPVWYWMLLWSLGYATCYAFKRAMPLLMGYVMPGCVGLVGLFMVFAP